jgi:uncharacterized membrane protein YidH (DUF202 family)
MMRPEPSPDEPNVSDPANRTRLAWTRTAIAFAAIGAAMAKDDLAAGVAVAAASVPIWAVARRVGRTAGARPSVASLRLVTAIVVLVALTALVVSFAGHATDGLARLLHDS